MGAAIKIDPHLKQRILIIDDDEKFATFAEHIFKKHGEFQVEIESSMDDPLKRIQTFRPDLLILDIKVPQKMGIEIQRTLDIIYEDHIPTIFVSDDPKIDGISKNQLQEDKTVFFNKAMANDQFEILASNMLVASQEVHESKNFNIRAVLQHQKPILITALTFLMCIEPIMKIMYFHFATNFGLNTIINNVLAIEGFKNNFEFWFLFPLSGIALYKIRPWSYLIFVTLQIYSIYAHLTYVEFTWPYVSKSPHGPSLLLLSFNVLVILYFLSPSARRPFFDANLRWWERAPRFMINLPCSIILPESKEYHSCEIKNISETGAFIVTPVPLDVGEMFQLDFKFYGQTFHFPAKVMNKFSHQNIEGHGIQFQVEQLGDRLGLRKLIKNIKEMK